MGVRRTVEQLGAATLHAPPLRMVRAMVLTVLVLVGTSAFTQETRVVGGKRFTVHRVEAGQTLFALSRAYAVPVEALLEANPDAREGLAIGQEVLVPVDAVMKKEVRSAPVMLSDGELRHTVQKKETLFGIARAYGVDVNALLERNPQAQTGLREGDTVIIPVAAADATTTAVNRPAATQHTVEHTVQQGETLYGLAQRYAVSVERITAANNGLAEGLKAGMVLKVPLPPGVEPPPPAPTAVAVSAHRITFALPFAHERNDSVKATFRDPSQATWYEPTRIAAQFYAGALIALDTLAAQGLNAEVHVLDIGDEARSWEKSLRRPELKEATLCIGPFHRSAIERLAQVNRQAHIVCPVPQPNKMLLGQPNVSKVAPSRPDLLRFTGRYVGQRHAADHILLLKPDIAADRETQDAVAKALNEALAQAGRDSAAVLRPGRRDIGDLASRLKADRLNVVVAPSDDVEYVTMLVAKLKPLVGKFRIALVGLESWHTMETVAAADLEPLGFRYAVASFIDVDDARVAAFIQAFRERFKTEPDEYAFLGHDVTLHYGTALLRGGGDLAAALPLVRSNTLHMDYRMVRGGPENGLRNEQAIMVLQQDLKLVRL